MADCRCKNCIHYKVCSIWSTTDLEKDEAYNYCFGNYKPTEDVVPRSEVEELQKTCDLFSETIKEMDKEIERLKVSDASKEECTIRQHCEIKELKSELSKAKQEVAREIFEEIEELYKSAYNKLVFDFGLYDEEKEFVMDLFQDLDLAELKKKYIGD